MKHHRHAGLDPASTLARPRLKAGVTAFLTALLLSSCGGGGLYTNADITPQSTLSQSADAGTATITKDAFLFASPYPARILIPDIDGMRDTAFVVSTTDPSGVIAIDLTQTPFVLSQKFKGVTSPTGSGLPNGLVIQSATRAFLLTSFAVVDFNPTTGGVNGTTMLPQTITLSTPLPLSKPFDYDNNGSDNTTITDIAIRSPGGIAIANNTLWIPTANYLRYTAPAVAAPGLVLRYTITSSGLTPASVPYIVTSGFNPTGIVATGSTVLVTNSGVIDIVGGEAIPQTPSSVDMWDATTGALIANVPADLAALSFATPAVDGEGRFAYYGSVAFSEVYQLDIAQRQFTRNLTNPIPLAGANTPDYITGMAISPDNGRAYVGSFDHSALFMLNLTASPINALSTSYSVGFPKGVSAENPTGVNTGVGDIAIRPGKPGVDFQGPDIFVLTGNPGTLVTIATQGGTTGTQTTIKSLSIAPSFIPIEVGKQGLATGDIVFSDGHQLSGIRDQFANPTTGQYQTLQWTSDNPSVATVSSSGLVTGVSGGITKIHAHVGTQSAEISVAVHLGSVTSAPSPSGNNPPPNPGKLVVVNCKDIGVSPFVQSVVGTQVGAGGGAGQDKLPTIVEGAPHGTGTMQGNTSDVYSLGAHGQIIVAFTDCMIADAPGVDFTVFENAFYAGGNPNAPFSEPAIVGVSMDGVTFTDFPCDLTQNPKYPGCAGTHPVLSSPGNGIDPLDPTVSGGDLFDLATINVPSAKFIRIIDQGLSPIYGANGTNGFDLDAIAVIHGAKPNP